MSTPCPHASRYFAREFGCPSCEVEARYANANVVRSTRTARRVRAVVRFFVPYVIVIAALIGLGLITRAIGAS